MGTPSLTENTAVTWYQQVLDTMDRLAAQLTREAGSQIHCKKGCFQCCTQGFKIRPIEVHYLHLGFQQAHPDIQATIAQQVSAPIHNQCPVLIDGACSLYAHRPLLCRAYGTMLSVNKTVSTCTLNFNEPQGTSPQVLILDPFYEVLDDLSHQLSSSQNPITSSTATIRAHFKTIFKIDS